MTNPRAAAMVWQDEPLNAEALRRIEDSADLPVKPTNRVLVRSALQRLANSAIHQAFQSTLSARDVAAVNTWARKSTPAAARNRDKAVAAARVRGSDPCPPADHRDGAALAEWRAFHGGMQRSANRPRAALDEKLRHRLRVCFWHLYGVAPDSSRGAEEWERDDGTRYTTGGAARFIHAFYSEIARAIARLRIVDPKEFGRSATWKVSTREAIVKALAASPGDVWRDWQIIEGGEIVRASGSLTLPNGQVVSAANWRVLPDGRIARIVPDDKSDS